MRSYRQRIKSYFIFSFIKHLLIYYHFFHHLIIPLLKNKNYPKVFCIGYAKTGTTSQYKALNILGYRSVKMLRGCVKPQGGWVEYIKKCNYDAFTDFPMYLGDLYKKLDKTIPNSKFILTIRDKNSWVKSFENFYGVSSEELNIHIQKYNDHNGQVNKYFKDKPSQLLVMNIIGGDGWDKLCKFLNKPIPTKPFPFKNRGNYKK
jgi:hypothetical protein